MLVPIDVFATLDKRADNAAVDVMWKVCYWSTQVRVAACGRGRRRAAAAAPAGGPVAAASGRRRPAAAALGTSSPFRSCHKEPTRLAPISPGPFASHDFRAQVLTWLVLPFFQVYADAGDFTVGARCMTSLKVTRMAARRAAASGPARGARPVPSGSLG